MGSFVEGAVAGTFSDNNSWSAIAGQAAVGFVPVVGQIADIRDAVASIGQIARGESGGWLNLGASLVGFVPGVGDVAKGLIRSGANAAEGGADVAAAAARAAPPPPAATLPPATPALTATPALRPELALATPALAPIARPVATAAPSLANPAAPALVRAATPGTTALAPAARASSNPAPVATAASTAALRPGANAAPASGNAASAAADAAPAVGHAARGADAAGPTPPAGSAARSGAGGDPPSLQPAGARGPGGPNGPSGPHGAGGTPPPRGPTESEGAQLAADSYAKVSRMTPDSGSRFIALSPAQALSELGLTQKMMGKSTFFSGGFARAYKAEGADGQAHYVVSFRGTNAASPRDWKSNVLQGLGFSTSHYRQALAIGKQLENVASRESLTMVGHSLGGGRASMAAIASGAKGLTYNAAGLHQRSIDTAEAAARDLRSFRPEVRAISTSGDILTRLSDTNRMLPEAFGSRELVFQRFAPAATGIGGRVSDAVQGLPGVQGVVAHLNTGVQRSVDAHYGGGGPS